MGRSWIASLAATAALAMAGSQAAPAMAQTLAFADLSNVSSQVGGSTFRTPADRWGEVADVEDYGGKGDNGTTDNCVPFQNALATGLPVHVPAASQGYILKNCYLTMTTTGQFIYGDGRQASVIQFTYTGSPTGPAITMGNGTALTQRVGLAHLRLGTALGQAAIWTRWVRDVQIDDITGGMDQFMRLGDETLGTTKDTYVVEILGATEIDQLLSPTMNFMDAYNFAGQLIMDHAFLAAGTTSPASSAVYGFNAAPNIQPRIDHIIVIGGYFSRWITNWYFHDARVVDGYWIGHHSENASDHAYVFDVPSSSTKASGSVGAENIHIEGGLVDSVNEGIFIKGDGPVTNQFDQIEITGVTYSGTRGTKSPIHIEAANTHAVLSDIQVTALTGSFSPADANQDGVTIQGISTAGHLSGVVVNGVTVESTGTALRSGVYVSGSGNSGVFVSNVTPVNATVAINDVNGLTDSFTRDGLRYAGTSLTPVNILTADSSASTGPMIFLSRTSASPAANDLLGALEFTGDNSAISAVNYGSMTMDILSPTASSESGAFRFVTLTAGSATQEGLLGGGLAVGSPTGGGKGTGTVNAQGAYYANGTIGVSCSGSPTASFASVTGIVTHC